MTKPNILAFIHKQKRRIKAAELELEQRRASNRSQEDFRAILAMEMALQEMRADLVEGSLTHGQDPLPRQILTAIVEPRLVPPDPHTFLYKVATTAHGSDVILEIVELRRGGFGYGYAVCIGGALAYVHPMLHSPDYRLKGLAIHAAMQNCLAFFPEFEMVELSPADKEELNALRAQINGHLLRIGAEAMPPPVRGPTTTDRLPRLILSRLKALFGKTAPAAR